MTDAVPVEPLSRLLLAGDAGARPEGLERALTRAGFRVSEDLSRNGAPPPDAVLLTLGPTDRSALSGLLQAVEPCAPRVILFAAGEPDLPAAALELGAADAVMAPVPLAELCARVHARIRDRQRVRRDAPPEGAVTVEHRLREEFERARRYSLSFSLVLVAIEALEDTMGRLDQADGGRLVADIVDQLRRTLRLPDLVSRYAGDEFAIVLPETDVAGARSSVSRLRARLAALPLDPEGGRLGLAAGIVGYPHPAVTQPDDMIALAEAALRRGRAQAGERVGVAE